MCSNNYTKISVKINVYCHKKFSLNTHNDLLTPVWQDWGFWFNLKLVLYFRQQDKATKRYLLFKLDFVDNRIFVRNREFQHL